MIRTQIPATNGKQPYQEIGTSGLNAWYGVVNEVFHKELQWPAGFQEINRIWRTDPEIAIIKLGYQTFAAQSHIQFESDPEEKNQRANDLAVPFGNSVLREIDGGIRSWLQQVCTRTPFSGWGYWEEVPGLRQQGWVPPVPPGGSPDPWRSSENDGLVGIRRLAFRDPSSFWRWELDDATGRVNGMWQYDIPNPEVLLPIDRAVHIIFGGDTHNPEGLSPLEAFWRLERLKYGHEQIFGIGNERTAGYLKFTTENELSGADQELVRQAATAVLTAQESNYLALPKGADADIIDTAFANAPALLEGIRYYGLLKLQLYNMQWVAIASTAGTGAYSAMESASGIFILFFNAMLDNFVNQLDAQLGRRLFEKYNKGRFPGLTKRPRLTVTKLEKDIDLKELAEFWQIIQQTMPTDTSDIEAIRRKSRILPEAPVEVKTTPVAPVPVTDTTPQDEAPVDDVLQEPPPAEASLQEGGAVIPKGAGQPLPEIPDTVEYTEAEIDAAVKRWKKVAPAEFKELVDAEVE